MLLGFIGFLVAAGFGAAIRYQAMSHFNFYWGTLLVNFLGSIAIGFLAIYLERTLPHLRVFILVAFLGSLTTFSSYSLDIVKLFESGQYLSALGYGLLTNTLCIGGCFVGWKFAQIA